MNYHWQIKKILTVLFCTILFSCLETPSETKTEKKYFNDLGEIPFDEEFDDINFKLCHEDITFPFNYGGIGLVYEGEKKQLVKTFTDNYQSSEIKGQNGFITIRFIINCEGKTGRFRVTEMDFNLKPKKFDKTISGKILDITKNLSGWKPHEQNGRTFDYQQYLTFKLNDGELTDILP
ncbi:hypothetical protein [uncultured Maribacter sp.]|uniref:hypothetical protein n=1 Tax=uncultured Maribacter sp. TaxID=431308 RepID=UPI00261EE0E9|nr:hypothetical protein [uncultured Maribacter sp.]